MRILLANYRYFVSSGPERYMFNLSSRLGARGHEVAPFSIRYDRNAPTPYERYFVSPLGGGDAVYFDEHKADAGAVGKTLSRLFYSKEVETSVGALADDFKPDIAYILYYLRKLSPSLLVGLKKRDIPIVVRLSDYGMFCPEHHCLRDGAPCTLCVDGDLSHSVRHRCVKGSLPISALDALATSFHRLRGYFDLIDAFVTTNSFMQEMMLRTGVPEQKLRCIPTFTDTDVFCPPPASGERRYFLCLGRLDQPKGVEVLIEAMAVLKQRMGDRTPMLKIVGGGHRAEYVARLHALSEARQLGDVVHFAGEAAPEQAPDLFRGALCAVIPALWFENLPNALIESLACGTSVVGSDIGSLAASLRDGEDSLLARAGDASDLAGKLQRIAEDASLRARLGQNARTAALTRFSADAHIRDLLSLFADCGAPSSTEMQRLSESAAA